MLFEASWEACSQTGGIYTVLRTKCAAGVESWGDDYCVIGPYRESAAKIEFEPRPHEDFLEAPVDELRSRGVVLHTGRWIITGHPRVILLDLDSVIPQLRDMKYRLWEELGISTPDEDDEANHIIAFGYVVADLLESFRRHLGDRPVLAQFHEWQGGAAVPILRHRESKVPTVFTTHATIVGRSLSAANFDLYGNMAEIDAEAVAIEHGVMHKYQLERAAAQAADTFTTVSEITALESEHFLGRKPEVVLPNGLNVRRAAAPHEFQNAHRQSKDRIHEFVMGHFFPSYKFDLDNTLYFFTAGRYEYRNKGIDVFIDALSELNRRMKAEATGTTVVAFIIVRAPCHALNVETLNRQAMLNELRVTCESIRDQMGGGLFQAVTDGRLPGMDDLMDEYARVRLQRMMHAWKQDILPTIVTHDMKDDLNDQVLCHLRKQDLINREDDPVKIVFHPEFISTTSPVLGMEYDQFVRGCNLGVFPSYYEPWGYTPMECVVRGIPAVTSDLSGFGLYVMEHFPEHDANGLYVAKRRQESYDQTVYQVTGWMQGMTRMTLRERIQLRNNVEAHAEFFDWSKMAAYYRAARRMALNCSAGTGHTETA